MSTPAPASNFAAAPIEKGSMAVTCRRGTSTAALFARADTSARVGVFPAGRSGLGPTV
ncbi:MAG: hypothetical protein JWR54_3964 [Mucilaginibacter sp.]|nr:hypothetical protein [Mucilaginibacter sp.]